MKVLKDKIDKLDKGKQLVVEFEEIAETKEVCPEEMKEAVKGLKLNESVIVRF